MQHGNVDNYCTDGDLFKIKTAVKSLQSKEIKFVPILVRKNDENVASDGKEVGNIFNEFYINFVFTYYGKSEEILSYIDMVIGHIVQ